MHRILVSFATTAAALAWASPAWGQRPALVGTRAPDFRAYTLESHSAPRTLADYRGKVVLLALWATWCRDCRDEMTSMQRLYDSFAGQGLRVVAVSVDRGGENRIREFVSQLGLKFDILRDESGKILATYGTIGVPTTILIGRDGVIRRRVLSGVDWDVDPRLKQIKELLAQPAPSPDSTARSGP